MGPEPCPTAVNALSMESYHCIGSHKSRSYHFARVIRSTVMHAECDDITKQQKIE